jgi:hypothetical protein
MGEVPLPPGPAPGQINAVYRLSDFDANRPPLDQPQAFNYWTPPSSGGIAQLVNDSPQLARLTGLRIGLGRRISVVVVATFNGTARSLGVVPVRRMAFIDGVSTTSQPLDTNAVTGYTPPNTQANNYYTVVSVDIYGNRSLPSKTFAASLLTDTA